MDLDRKRYFELAATLTVDWAEFGSVTCENSQRKLYALFTTLAYSRALHVTFSYSMRMPYLLEAQRRAFVWLGGVPRKCLYANMKSVVLARVGRHAQMNDELLEFAKQYRFLVEVTGVRKPNEKGRVERSIQYFRGSFFDHRDSTYDQGLEKRKRRMNGVLVPREIVPVSYRRPGTCEGA